MSSFLVNQNLSRGDLRLFLSNQNGYAQDAFSVKWTIYSASGKQSSGKSLPAIRARCGEYYAPWHTDVKNGSYQITWEVREISGGPVSQHSEGIFIVDPSSYIPGLPPSGDAVPVEGFSTFLTGQFLGPKDLPLYLKDDTGYPQDAYAVFWTVFDALGRVLVPKTYAVNHTIGEYYASWLVMVHSGNYTILWEYQEDQNSPVQSAKMNFSVICPAAPYVVLAVENCFPCQPALAPVFAGSCGGIITVNCPPLPPLPPLPPMPPNDPCCGYEIPRATHLPSQVLPLSGAFTNQAHYIIPQRIRRVAFYVTYTRGAPGGFVSLRLMWGNGTEESQETLIDMNFDDQGTFSSQNLYLQDLEGPVPTDGNPVSFLVEASVPGGATTVRLVAAEGGVISTPGTIKIILTASSN